MPHSETETNARVPSEELWRHSNPESTPMWKFMQEINKKHNTNLKTYQDLHEWSTDHISEFWAEVWHFTGVVASEPFQQVVDESAPMYPRPTWFSGAKLNFAQNLLYPPVEIDPSSPAIIGATESARQTVSWAEMRERVKSCQNALKELGVTVNDRVAGYAGNHVNAVVWMLATTSLGAVWTGVSPDSGVPMVVDRLSQIKPKLLFTDDGQFYNGKRFSVLEKVAELVKSLDSLEAIVVHDVVGKKIDGIKNALSGRNVVPYSEFLERGKTSSGEIDFVQLPPDHPIYILYSSGTTGAPKCIVHGAIGTLIQHKKEHILHCSILPTQRLFYYTTTTWMMWHWLISGLAAGATLILYDGSPLRYRSSSDPSGSTPDDLAMPRLLQELEIQHFGTSAKYLSVLEQKSLFPSDHGIKMPALQAIYNTASPLAPSTFRYVYRAFGTDLNLGSITGGTDIISLFGAACPLLPVHAGEVQCIGLGMAVRAWDEHGNDVSEREGVAGDLVCVRAFPCQPVAFWGEGGEKKYRGSYFEKFEPGMGGRELVWHHGDFIELNPKTGGILMLGRSDGVLNPAGIRFGSAEVYNVLLKQFAGKVADGLCIGRKKPEDVDETVVLFLKMEPGVVCDEELVKEVKKQVRLALSARHVPGVVDECPDIPVTVNGKKIEGAVKQIISGSKVKTSASVANAECLEFYREWAARN